MRFVREGGGLGAAVFFVFIYNFIYRYVFLIVGLEFIEVFIRVGNNSV